MADAQRNTALYDKNSLKSDETLEKFVFSSLGTSSTPWIPRHTNLLLSHCGTQNQGVFGRLLAVRPKSDGIAYSR